MHASRTIVWTKVALLHSPECQWGRKEQTKASYVARVECLPRVGPVGDIFLGVLNH